MTRTSLALGLTGYLLAMAPVRAEDPPGPCCSMSAEARMELRGAIPTYLLVKGPYCAMDGASVLDLQRTKAEILPWLIATLECHGDGDAWTGHLEAPWLELDVQPSPGRTAAAAQY